MNKSIELGQLIVDSILVVEDYIIDRMYIWGKRVTVLLSKGFVVRK